MLAEFQKEDPETKKPYADSFGWLSHTYDTPYLDVGCATQNYIEAQLNENTEWAAAKPGATPGTGGLGLTETSEPTLALGAENPKVFVPGNHSGFADLVPGNPATVDEPDLDPSTVNETRRDTARRLIPVRGHRPVHELPERRAVGRLHNGTADGAGGRFGDP